MNRPRTIVVRCNRRCCRTDPNGHVAYYRRNGCATREQAIEFCDVLAEYYGERADAHGWDRDTWTVERRPICIENVVAPDVTAAQYMEFVLR